MPTVSDKQERFMQAVAHNPKFAKKVGVPQSVGKEFTMKKMGMGGMAEPKAMVKKEVAFMKKKCAPKSMLKHEMAEMKGMKRGGMASGGLAAGHKAADGIAKKGKTRGMEVTMKGSTGMKAGGKVKKMNYGGKC